MRAAVVMMSPGAQEGEEEGVAGGEGARELETVGVLLAPAARAARQARDASVRGRRGIVGDGPRCRFDGQTRRPVRQNEMAKLRWKKNPSPSTRSTPPLPSVSLTLRARAAQGRPRVCMYVIGRRWRKFIYCVPLVRATREAAEAARDVEIIEVTVT